MTRALAWPAAAAALFLFLVAARAAPPDGLRPGPDAVVADVIDGDTVILRDPIMGASQVRLVGIQAPKLPLGRPGFKAWPLGDEAKAALESLLRAQGGRVRLSFGGAERDRHGRLLAHLTRPDGVWIQGEMLRLGLARVYSFADNRAAVDAMLAAERDARARGAGIWGEAFYAVRPAAPADTLRRFAGTFQLVEGRVLRAAKVKGRVYLNFGDDWRTDFTVALDGKAGRLFKKAALDPLALEGKRVRVRGWLKDFNGPAIDASHPEQVETLQ